MALTLRLPFRWLQGEHLAVVGETGTGKSTLAAALLAGRWSYYIAIRTKPDDVSYLATTIHKADKLDSGESWKYLLDLSGRRKAEQAREVRAVAEQVWDEGGWTIYFDELFYVERLRLTDDIEHLLTQGRSKHITVMVGMQRPARVTRFALSQATHVLSFRQEGRDAKVLGEATSRLYGDTVAGLEEYEFAWYYRSKRAIWTGRLQDLVGLAEPSAKVEV